jgi:hypothetical protein
MTTLSGNPYVGPRTFTEAQKDYFFGRDREAEDLLALVLSERLVLFYAQSGAGKSSLINTRLIPGLRAEGFEILPVGRVSGQLPDGLTPDEVANIFTFNLILKFSQNTAPTLAELRRWGRLRLADFLADDDPAEAVQTGGVLNPPEVSADQTTRDVEIPADWPEAEAGYVYETVPYLLVIDQFEEIVTTEPSRWPERADFFEQLRQTLERHPNLWLVLTMREDFVAALDPYLQQLTNRLRARFYMQRMGYQSALEAIIRPAKLGGRPFAPGVAESLVDNLRQVKMQGQAEAQLGQYVEPVQLQVVCFQLWQNLIANLTGLEDLSGLPPQITAADLATLGNVDSALAEFYEGTVRQALTWFNPNLTPPPAFQG